MNESQLSMTMGSVISQEAPTPTHPGGNDHTLEVGGMGIGDVTNNITMVQGEGGGGGGGMSAGEIKKLFAQFKNDMKPMITDIAERLSENKVVNLKRITDLYEQTNEKDKKMIVQKLEDQMLVISNHLKKKIDKMNTDFED